MKEQNPMFIEKAIIVTLNFDLLIQAFSTLEEDELFQCID